MATSSPWGTLGCSMKPKRNSTRVMPLAMGVTAARSSSETRGIWDPCHYEPNQHDWPEYAANPGRSFSLNNEQQREDNYCQRHDGAVHLRGIDLDAFDGT